MPLGLLQQIANSMAATARAAGVSIVTGDTKVVQKGACDQIFINTAGIGVIPEGTQLSVSSARPGNAILVNGQLGDHGAAILGARGDMALESPIESDCAALHGLIAAVLKAAPGIRFIRDATRGGIATVLNEIAAASRISIEIEERLTPIREDVRGFCEILGIDPLYLANEGKVVIVAPHEESEAALAAMRAHPLGVGASIIGTAGQGAPGRVTMKSIFGGRRIVDMLVGEQLPRIC